MKGTYFSKSRYESSLILTQVKNIRRRRRLSALITYNYIIDILVVRPRWHRLCVQVYQISSEFSMRGFWGLLRRTAASFWRWHVDDCVVMEGRQRRHRGRPYIGRYLSWKVVIIFPIVGSADAASKKNT